MTGTQAMLPRLWRFAAFSGRAGLAEYRRVTRRINVVGNGLLVLLAAVALILTKGTDAGFYGTLQQWSWLAGFNVLIALAVGLAVLLRLPASAIGARRLHDTGRSGWWLALPETAVLGLLALAWIAFIPPGTPVPEVAAVLSMPKVWLAYPLLFVGLAALIAVFFLLSRPLNRALAAPSSPGPNRYGPHPSEVTP